MFGADDTDSDRWGDSDNPNNEAFGDAPVDPRGENEIAVDAADQIGGVSTEESSAENSEESSQQAADVVNEESVPEESVIAETASASPATDAAIADVVHEPVTLKADAGTPPPTEVEVKKAVRELTPEQLKLPWYVVHTYSGFEQYAKRSLEERIKVSGSVEHFGNILIPQETVIELVRGKKKTSTRKYFPGYMLVQMNLTDETWHVVKDTPKVTGFVGDSTNPVPISEQEVKNLVAQMEGGALKPRPKVQFEEGDAVKVVDGPFAEFNGTVDEVKPDKGKVRVLISIFGRNTPVELDFVQVEKA